MSKVCILCHVVFGTKNRERTINPERKRELYNYFYGILNKKKCLVSRINGMEDHVHLLFELHPSVALADIVKILKQGSSNWIRKEWVFPMFRGWGNGYFAASIGMDGKEACRQYIMNQELHHKKCGYKEELQNALKSMGMEWYDDEWK